MKVSATIVFVLTAVLFLSCNDNSTTTDSSILTTTDGSNQVVEYAMVIHGGAGTILRENMDEETEKAYNEILTKVLIEGEQMLKDGMNSEEVVVKSIMKMEDSPLFNAGKGAVFTNEETNELDASIMRGSDQQAGAVSGITSIRNPITAALAVLNKSEHVLLSGIGADKFAAENGCEVVDPSYFHTERRLNSLNRIKAKEDFGTLESSDLDYKYGTVGCVVLDKKGNIVAGTSTGGMTNKKYNRIGDSPLIGAGTYADNSTCGVSSTGHGEYFIRYTVAYDIAARMEYKGLSVNEAAKEVVMDKLVKKGGSGGVVALSKTGEIAMIFNTPGMYRGYVKPGELVVKIYED